MHRLTSLVAGDLSDADAATVRDQWHGRVLQILTAPAGTRPFTFDVRE